METVVREFRRLICVTSVASEETAHLRAGKVVQNGETSASSDVCCCGDTTRLKMQILAEVIRWSDFPRRHGRVVHCWSCLIQRGEFRACSGSKVYCGGWVKSECTRDDTWSVKLSLLYSFLSSTAEGFSTCCDLTKRESVEEKVP